MKRLFFVLIIVILVGILYCVTCIKPLTIKVSKEYFISENLLQSFDDWKNWSISYYRLGIYIAFYGCTDSLGYFQQDSLGHWERLIFWDTDSVPMIRLTPGDTISKIHSINTVTRDSLWSLYPHINIEELKSHVNFVLKYPLSGVGHAKNPDRLYFGFFPDNKYASDSTLLYFFEPIEDPEWWIFTKKYNSHWFGR